MTGTEDNIEIAVAFATEGFSVRAAVLVDRRFQVADEDEYADVYESVLRSIKHRDGAAALAACKAADLFVEQVRLFDKQSGSSVEVRQNGVIVTAGIELFRVVEILTRALDVR